MRRSGSTLAFNLVRELLGVHFKNRAVETTYADQEAADRFVETALRTGSAFVLKTHESGVSVDRLIAQGCVKAIYTWRDPRDAVVSIMTFLKLGLAEAIDMVARSLRKFEESWRAHCLTICYPELYPLTPALILKISSYLDIP